MGGLILHGKTRINRDSVRTFFDMASGSPFYAQNPVKHGVFWSSRAKHLGKTRILDDLGSIWGLCWGPFWDLFRDLHVKTRVNLHTHEKTYVFFRI